MSNGFDSPVVQSYRMMYWVMVMILGVSIVLGVAFFSEGNGNSSGEALITDFPPIFQTAITLEDDSPAVRQTATQLPATGEGSIETGVEVGIPSQQISERVILRDADLNMLVEDVTATTNQITATVMEVGGWIVEATTTNTGKGEPSDLIVAHIYARVPAEDFDALLAEVKGLAVQITVENIRSSDVTQAYVDTESRLRNLEAAETQLQSILAEAKTTQDVLAVFNQLTVIRGEIEVLKGQLRYYDEAEAYSSLDIQLSPYVEILSPTPHPSITPTAGWSPRQTFEDATDSAVSSVQGGVDAVIWAGVYGLLVLLVIILPLVAVLRWITRR